MIDLVLLLAGLAVGAGGAWLIARGHFHAEAAVEREALGARLAAAETLADATQKQLSQRELDVTSLRSELTAEQTLRAGTEARWDAARQSLEEQRRLFDQARDELTRSFEALSAEALRKSNTSFLELARQALDAQLNPREQAIKGLVQPLADSLVRYEKELRELESARQDAYGTLKEQLRALSATSEQLQRETGTLATALSKSSQARGGWGEITLRRVVEAAGMNNYCDFSEQVSRDGEEGRVRPDLVVRLPGKREIVVDAKAPLSAYFEALAATRPEDREAALSRHAQQLRQHMTQLGSKRYWADFAGAADFVVLFVPGEVLVATAFEADNTLIEYAMTKRVIVVTPMTLMGLLLAVHYGWRQAQMAESAQRISALGKDLYDRVRTLGGHFENVRKGLVQATRAYNATVGSLEGRVLPAARKFEELAAAAGDTIDAIEPIDEQPRALTAPELLTQETLPEVEP